VSTTLIRNFLTLEVVVSAVSSPKGQLSIIDLEDITIYSTVPGLFMTLYVVFGTVPDALILQGLTD
jgi:hypothetical protein